MTGNLIIRNDVYHIRINYKKANGKWASKTRSTKLHVKGNKKRAQAMLDEFMKQFELENTSTDKAVKDYLFTEYLDIWLDFVKPSLLRQRFRIIETALKLSNSILSRLI